MTIVWQLEWATALAAQLQDAAEEGQVHAVDVLDALASTSLKLAADETGVAGTAYLFSLEEGR